MREEEQQISFKSFFVPFTTVKAVHFIIFIGLLVYIAMLFNGFVGDDNGQILTNPAIHSLSNIPQFFKGSTLFLEEVGASAGLYYRPLMSTSFAIIYALFGAVAFPFHLFQLLLHIGNAILIFFLFKKHLKLKVSFVLALLFLLHPINNEAVVYISNLQEQLFSFFGLLGLLTVSHKKWIYATPLFLFLSLLNKETGLLFLPLTTLYYVLFCKPSKKSILMFISAIVFVFVCYLSLRVFVGNTGINTQFLYMSANATFVERLYTIPSLIDYYLRNTFLPFSIAFGWYWVIKEPNVYNFVLPLFISSLLITALVLPAFFLKKKNKKQFKTYLFFLCFFVLNLGLVLQLFPLDLTVADRWFYMPVVGLLGMAGLLYDVVSKKIHKHKQVSIIVIIFVCMLLTYFGIRDSIRNTNWVDNFTLCQHDAQINTTSYILEFCLSNEYYNRQDYKNAELHAQKALALYPEYFLSWYTLGKAYYANNEKEKARDAFSQSLKYNDFALGSEELALIYVYEKNTKKAREVTRKYLPKLPYSAQLWYALALTEYIDGNAPQATQAAQKAYELQPTPLTEKVYYRLKNNLPISFNAE